MAKTQNPKGASSKPVAKDSSQSSKPQSNKGTTPAKSTPSGKSAQPVKKGQPVQKHKKKQFNWRTWLWPMLGIAILVGLTWFVMQQNQTNQSASSLPKEISVEEAAKLRDEGAFILDVRTEEEWNEYHIPGSTLIPLDQLETRLSEVPQGKEVVVVCRSGNRSQPGRDVLKNAGFTQVTSMSGGLKEWKAAGLPTVAGP